MSILRWLAHHDTAKLILGLSRVRALPLGIASRTIWPTCWALYSLSSQVFTFLNCEVNKILRFHTQKDSGGPFLQPLYATWCRGEVY